MHTVDGYQGEENDVVVVSLVRANDRGETAPLLADPRRVNVAITRAQHRLLLVGSGRTAATDSVVTARRGR